MSTVKHISTIISYVNSFRNTWDEPAKVSITVLWSGSMSVSVLIRRNDSSRCWLMDDLNRFLIIFNFENARSQLTWVHASVKMYLYAKYRLLYELVWKLNLCSKLNAHGMQLLQTFVSLSADCSCILVF